MQQDGWRNSPIHIHPVLIALNQLRPCGSERLGKSIGRCNLAGRLVGPEETRLGLRAKIVIDFQDGNLLFRVGHDIRRPVQSGLVIDRIGDQLLNLDRHRVEAARRHNIAGKHVANHTPVRVGSCTGRIVDAVFRKL